MKKIIFFIFLFVFFISSSVFPFSIQDEIKLGKDFKRFISIHFIFVKDPYIVSYVKRVLNKITSVIPDLPFNIKLYVIKDNSVNAFAAPAGYVFVNSGLIANMDNEDELAAILAHELAHVRQRHLAKNIERSKYLTTAGLVGVLAGILVGNPAISQAIAISTVAGVQTASLKYSRDNERDADKLGLDFLIRAGYSPFGMVGAFEKIRQIMRLSGVNSPPPYMLTHPGLEERIGYIKDTIAHIQKIHPLKAMKSLDLGYLRVKVLTEARYGRETYSILQKMGHEEKIINKGKCIIKLGELILYSKLGRYDKARNIINTECVSLNDPLWIRETGIYYFFIKKFKLAEQFLKKAVSLKPDDNIAIIYLVRTLKSRGEYDLAISYAKRILAENSMDREAHFILSQLFGEKGDLFRGYLHLAYFYLYKGNKRKSLFYFNKAKTIDGGGDKKFMLKKFKVAFKRIFK